MRNIRVARRYATALMTAAEESRLVDKMAADLQKVGNLLEGSRELRLFVASPVVPAQKKMTVMREIFGTSVGKEVMSFFLFLIEKRREELLADIIGEFSILLDKRQGVVEANVRSALAIDGEQERLLKKRLEAYTAKNVRTRFAIDSSLKGGLVIQIGDTVLDGSIKHQLELLKDRFVAGGHFS
jgi:F-type H+-transporting ATPase subunit delta